MTVRWRSPGEPMGIVDLRLLEGDELVIHYGGSLGSIDAYTFANSLVALADTARSINTLIDPDRSIEIRVEALSEGSFRASIKKITKLPKGLSAFFQRGAENLLWAYLAWLILEGSNKPDQMTVVVNDETVVITRGADKIIVPRIVYDKAPEIKADKNVQKNMSKTFETMEGDDAVSNFGITPKIKDAEPLVQIGRTEFERLADYDVKPLALAPQDATSRRLRTERARLVIIKLWFKTSTSRKWTFEWNGVPISAPIKDADFLAQLERREHLIGSGDALDVDLSFQQDFDPGINMWVNDNTSFEIMKVIGVLPRGTQHSLLT